MIKLMAMQISVNDGNVCAIYARLRFREAATVGLGRLTPLLLPVTLCAVWPLCVQCMRAGHGVFLGFFPKSDCCRTSHSFGAKFRNSIHKKWVQVFLV